MYGVSKLICSSEEKIQFIVKLIENELVTLEKVQFIVKRTFHLVGLFRTWLFRDSSTEQPLSAMSLTGIYLLYRSTPMNGFIHAVPNFSEGRDQAIIDAVVAPFKRTEGVKLIATYPDADFNRTVIEAIGTRESLKKALLEMAGEAYRLINMEKQQGRHPRIGAQDTIPLFPLKGVTLEECVQLAEEIGTALYEQYKVPVFFSGENARNEDRKNLSFIREGQYEGLKKVAHLPERAPDIGPAALHPTAGATIVSAAVSGLTAVNVVLDTADLSIAKAIAKMVRGPSGGFSTIRAVGFTMEDKGKVAVSMNMFDTDNTPIYRVFHVIESEAERLGVRVLGTQLVGTLHNQALIDCAAHSLRLMDFSPEQIIENHMLSM